jgi:hypothetical protein
MNLLDDLKKEFSTTTPPQVENEPIIEPERPKAVRPQNTSKEWKPVKPKNKSSFPRFFLTGSILIALIIVVYFFFFRETTKHTQPIAQNSEMKNVLGDLGQVSERTTIQSNEQIIPNADNQNNNNLASPAPSIKAHGLKGMMVLAATLSLFTNSLPPDVKVNTLYLDEGNFTADFATDTNVESFYTVLVNKCPKEVTLSALPKSGLNNRTLISGSINLSIQDFVQTSPFSTVDVEKEITTLTSEVGVQLINLNVGQSRLLENLKNADIFIKVEGSFLQCQAFFEGIAEKNWYLRVSKILFIPTTGHNATLVLRFQKIESVIS